jgi:hypothetical protein
MIRYRWELPIIETDVPGFVVKGRIAILFQSDIEAYSTQIED